MNRSPHFSTWITLCLVVAALAVQSAAVELPHKIVLNAPFTPFKNDSSQAVNLEPIAALAKHAKEVGVNVVWACGGMGQFDTLTMDERKAIALEWVVEGHKNGLYIIVHVGTTVLAEAIELAQHAASIGADAIASVPPYYEHGSFDEVVDFLNRISQQGAPKLPFFYYHIPGSTHQDMNIYDLLTAAPTKLPMLGTLYHTTLFRFFSVSILYSFLVYLFVVHFVTSLPFCSLSFFFFLISLFFIVLTCHPPSSFLPTPWCSSIRTTAGVKYVSSDLVDFMNCQNDYGDKYAMMFAPEPKITGIALGARYVFAYSLCSFHHFHVPSLSFYASSFYVPSPLLF